MDRCSAAAWWKFPNEWPPMSRWPSCFLGDVWGLVVRLILGCRLRHDWIKADAVDGLALKLHPGRFDLDLVPRPVIGLPVGPIEHHGADVAFKVQNVFFLRGFAFTD